MIARPLRAALLGASFTAASAASAQVPPPQVAPQIDPGLVNQQNRRNQLQLEQQVAPLNEGPAVVAPGAGPAVIAAPGGPTIALKRVVFDVSQFISPGELDAIAAPYVGRRVDISQIQRLVKAVNDLYAAKGIVTASASLPPQDLKSGTLHVALIEGRLGRVTVKNNVRLSGDYLVERIGQVPGTVVDVPALTDAVAGFNKTGVAQVQAFLQPGAQFGLTDIQLAVIEPPANALNVFVDNQGVDSVGRLEGGFLYQKYAPFGIDDKLTLYGVLAEGNRSINGAYNVPFDVSGGRVGLSVSHGSIHVVNGPYEPLHILGDSTIVALNASQPIFTSQNWLFLANGAISYGASNSTQSLIPITDNKTYKGTGGFTLAYTDPTFSASISPNFSRAHTDVAVTGTNLDYNLYNGTFSALYRMPFDFVATLGGAFQVSSIALLPGDQLFQIGGPTTVRGYPSDALAGATGYYGNLELHHNLDFVYPGIDAYIFYDHGAVYNPNPAEIDLNSAGLGLSWDIQKVAVAEIGAGFPLTHALDKQPDCEVYFRLTAKIQ